MSSRYSRSSELCHLALRFQGRLAAAELRHDAVESDLVSALEALRSLGYPYHVALVQTDLAEWLSSQARPEEASVLLNDALTSFRVLGAQPAIERAERLADRLVTAPTG